MVAAAATTDAVRAALEDGDVFVGSGQMGARAPEARRELKAVAAELRATDRPVKLAIVADRGSSDRLRAYARTLRGDLGFDGTVVLVTPGGSTAAVGPGEPAVVTLRLRAARIGRIADPVARLVSAAEVTAVAPPSAGGTQTFLTLAGLAVLGGAWALALGAGRRVRAQRRRLAEERAAMRVHLDALRVRAAALARGGRLDEAGRRRVQSALATYADVVAELQQADSAATVEALGPRVARAVEALRGTARDAGEDWAQGYGEDPFAGLCGADPVHGPATRQGPLVPGGTPVPLCADCAALAARGEAPPLRHVPVDGRPVPFSQCRLPGRGPDPATAA